MMLGADLSLCGLLPEDQKIYEKALEIEEKMKLRDFRLYSTDIFAARLSARVSIISIRHYP